MIDAGPQEERAGAPEGSLLAAWLAHEAALWARLSVERGRGERRALWRALANARRLLDRIDPARGGAPDAAILGIVPADGPLAGMIDPNPPSVAQVIATRADEWDAFLDRLEQGFGREPDAAP